MIGNFDFLDTLGVMLSTPVRLEDMLNKIDDPRRDAILRIYKDHEDLFHKNPGSTHNHQTWEGGLADHLADMFRLAPIEYAILDSMTTMRREKVPFTLGSAQIVIWCHDAEKLYVYGKPDDPRCEPFIGGIDDPSDKSFKEDLKWKVLEHWHVDYGLELTAAESSAIEYVHGEGDDYRNDRRVMNELAAFVGNIDRTSARILHESGKDLG